MATHYPLNGIDLDFRRYEHRPLGARDIMVNRIMEDYMNPKRIKPYMYSGLFDLELLFNPIKGRDRELGLDMQILWKLLKTKYHWPSVAEEARRIYLPAIDVFFQYLGYSVVREIPTAFETIILDMVERHYVESDPLMQTWLKHFNACYASKRNPGRQDWKKTMVEHMKELQKNAEVHQCYSLYSGDHQVPVHVPRDIRFSIDPCFTGIARLDTVLLSRDSARPYDSVRRVTMYDLEGVKRGRPKRSSSAPLYDAWSTAQFQGIHMPRTIFYPRRPLALLDKLSRRRSLSRTHIRAMFTDKPKWFREKPRKQIRKDIKHPCTNCAQRTHLTKDCPSCCGYCRSTDHKANICPVKASNRCKCMPFPQYHLAGECPVRCSRRCGCPDHPGHFKHKNAMLCNYRCCMCGTKGHSGRKCSMKECPCGEQHLTQDCRWKVECPAKDCNYYLCRLHCRECGKKKEKGSQDQFVGRTCQDCLGNGIPVR
ncbi:hypothetical protein GGS26DRAFT_392824 [Hypomontagnella submonticulosa]|nr:hypothetical protein GGS26DRAFT_392824 [Hypomontagnella submonticulosa]